MGQYEFGTGDYSDMKTCFYLLKSYVVFSKPQQFSKLELISCYE